MGRTFLVFLKGDENMFSKCKSMIAL